MFESIKANKGKGINMPQELIDEVVEEHKEKESKSKSNILDISHLDNFVANEGEVNIDPKIMKAYEEKKAAKLEKEKKKGDTSTKPVSTPVEPQVNPGATHVLLRSALSVLDYRLLNGNPKKIMKFILEKYRKDQGGEFDAVFIDTYELKDKTSLSSESIRQALKILKRDHYIFVELARSNGMRMIKINESLKELTK